MFAKVLVGAKHCGSKSLMITNKLSAAMLRPYKIEIHPTGILPIHKNSQIYHLPQINQNGH